MLRYILLILMLSSCSESADYSTPAQAQIAEYRAQIGKCKDVEQSSVKTMPAQQEEVTQTAPVAPVEVAPVVKHDASTIFTIKPNEIILGNPEAKVTVIEYAGPTCAHCAYFHKKIYPDLRKNYIDTGKIAYVLRIFVANKQDLAAGVLSLCASKTIFHKLFNTLLAEQESWAFNSNFQDILTDIGNMSGITPEQYKTCLDSKEISGSLIDQARAIGHVSGFIGTPSFIINDALFNKPYTYENLAAEIEKGLTVGN